MSEPKKMVWDVDARKWVVDGEVVDPQPPPPRVEVERPPAPDYVHVYPAELGSQRARLAAWASRWEDAGIAPAVKVDL